VKNVSTQGFFMRAATRNLLESLESVTWFHAVGKPDENHEAIFVPSWKAALEYCNADEWQDARTDADNDIRIQLPKERMKVWNDLVEHLKPHVEELVETKVLESKQRIPKFKDVLGKGWWDIMRALMEWEYDDVLTTHFYRDAVAWYLRGHFPCGYETMSQKHVVY
jgi:hypothetical protein